MASRATANCADPIANASNSNQSKMLAANERDAVHPGGNAVSGLDVPIDEPVDVLGLFNSGMDRSGLLLWLRL
jgi:hypothetical protein